MWWHTLLPNFNGIYLFQEERPEIRLFSDATQKWLGAYFTHSREDSIQQANSISMLVKDDHLGQHINIPELRAIQAAFLTWAQIWSQKTVIVHTDSEIAFWALANHKAYGPAFYPLRHILLLASTLRYYYKTSAHPWDNQNHSKKLRSPMLFKLDIICPEHYYH